MSQSQKSWYNELIKISENSPNYYPTKASHLRSVQALIADPYSQIHQLFIQEKGPLPKSKTFTTLSKDLAFYFSGCCPYEDFNPMPVGVILKIDNCYVSRALAWSTYENNAFFSNIKMTSFFTPGVHTVRIEPLNKNIIFDETSFINLTIIEF
ncbi:MAG: hypothetical protein H6696_16770 [Deferribacteres bacterium]|nr:hypothetical protein [candidate division KSB1 bacterium]MCB9503588.1 hypothetical protein [Deferribacteres bacterium]